jgi:hypothetical protein
MFTQILVPLDGSALAERALPAAARLAAATGAALRLVRVVGNVNQEVTLLRVVDTPAQGPEAERYLKQIARSRRAAGVRCTWRVEQGNPADHIIAAAGPRKQVDDGVVTLHGTVSTDAKRQAAAEAAHRVPNVRDVVNNIVVKLPGIGTPTDTELAQAVRTALELQEMVPHERIRTTVCDGCVTLHGTVDQRSQREAAERAVRRIAGMQGVTNAIAVQAQQLDADEDGQSVPRN